MTGKSIVGQASVPFRARPAISLQAGQCAVFGPVGVVVSGVGQGVVPDGHGDRHVACGAPGAASELVAAGGAGPGAQGIERPLDVPNDARVEGAVLGGQDPSFQPCRVRKPAGVRTETRGLLAVRTTVSIGVAKHPIHKDLDLWWQRVWWALAATLTRAKLFIGQRRSRSPPSNTLLPQRLPSIAAVMKRVRRPGRVNPDLSAAETGVNRRDGCLGWMPTRAGSIAICNEHFLMDVSMPTRGPYKFTYMGPAPST